MTADPTLAPGQRVEWIQWVGAVLGACLVGLTGVLPLWVIPAKALPGSTGIGPTDDNLK
jgi:hypothetical protein